MINKINTLLFQAHENLSFDTTQASCVISARKDFCDFQCNSSFTISKKQNKSPFEISKMLANELTKLSTDFVFSSVGGFINITMTNKTCLNLLNSFNERLNIPKSETKKIIVDFGGANIAKPLHVGHLRSAVIGNALKNLCRFMGNEVIGDAHLGDWGLQMGLTIALLLEKYDCGYFMGEKKEKPVFTLDILNEIYPAASKRSKEDADFLQKAKETTVLLQNHDPVIFSIWQDIRNSSIIDVQKDYDSLSVSFDLFYGESNSAIEESEVLEILKSKNLLKSSDGALIVDVANENDIEPMPPCLIKASSGASLYATTDLATILQRKTQFNPDEIIYVVDNRQALHLKQVFRVSEMAGIISKSNLIHVNFGTMNGKDGKPFKTRAGGTLKLKDLVALLIFEADKKIKENKDANQFDEILSRQIGIAALKFGDLINQSGKDYVFDIEKFSSFEGKTGPYLQYCAVRIKSILSKCKRSELQEFSIETQEEKAVIMQIYEFSKAIESAYKNKEISILCSSMYNICLAFSSLYSKCKIISNENEIRRNTLLLICEKTLHALKVGASIIEIELPEKM